MVHARSSKSHGPSQRQLRFGENVRHLLVDTIRRIDSLDHTPITISEVRVTPDLGTATAYVTPLGGTNTEAVVKELNEHGKELRMQIAKCLTSKTIPRLLFKADTSFEEAERLEQLLRNPKVLRDLETKD